MSERSEGSGEASEDGLRDDPKTVSISNPAGLTTFPFYLRAKVEKGMAFPSLSGERMANETSLGAPGVTLSSGRRWAPKKSSKSWRSTLGAPLRS
jgi:hypothetical protein